MFTSSTEATQSGMYQGMIRISEYYLHIITLMATIYYLSNVAILIVDTYGACDRGTQAVQIELNKDNEELIITSPGYPVSYPDNADCQWHFTTEDGYILYVNFIAFDMEPE